MVSWVDNVFVPPFAPLFWPRYTKSAQKRESKDGIAKRVREEDDRRIAKRRGRKEDMLEGAASDKENNRLPR